MRSGFASLLARNAPAAALAALAVGGWEVAARRLGVPDIILPRPSAVALALVDRTVNWPHHIAVTALEVVTGFAGAVVLGIGLAVVLVMSPFLARVVLPWVLLAQIVPKIAFAPILFLALGYNQLPTVIITFLVAFFPMVIDTAAGLRALDPRMTDLLRSFQGSRWDVLRKAQFPTSLPFVFSGLKVSSTLAVVGANVAEFVSARAGLGFLIINAQVTFNASLAFAAATYLILLGVVFYALIAALERWTMPWAAAHRAA
jgi:NitT/TauT family transport system permease protein